MKFILPALLLCSVVKADHSGNSFVLTKTFAGQSSRAPNRTSTTCELTQDKLVVKKVFGGLVGPSIAVTETRPVVIDGQVLESIRLAANEARVETPNNLCDGPYQIIGASYDGDKLLQLFSSGGCGNPGIRVTGPNGLRLQNLMNSLCR